MKPDFQKVQYVICTADGKFLNTIHLNEHEMPRENVEEAFFYNTEAFARADMEKHQKSFPGASLKQVTISYVVTNLTK